MPIKYRIAVIGRTGEFQNSILMGDVWEVLTGAVHVPYFFHRSSIIICKRVV